jgi:hypothetical protein
MHRCLGRAPRRNEEAWCGNVACGKAQPCPLQPAVRCPFTKAGDLQLLLLIHPARPVGIVLVGFTVVSDEVLVDEQQIARAHEESVAKPGGLSAASRLSKSASVIDRCRSCRPHQFLGCRDPCLLVTVLRHNS